MVHFPRECAPCFRGEPLTPISTSYVDAKGYSEKVPSAFKKPNGRVPKSSISTSKFPVFGLVTRQRYVAERTRTGGVAVILPPEWEILEELELVPGRAVAVKVKDRTCQFFLISTYLHPERRKQDAEALLRAWRRLDRTNQFVF